MKYLFLNFEEVEQKENNRSGLGQKGDVRIWRNQVFFIRMGNKKIEEMSVVTY